MANPNQPRDPKTGQYISTNPTESSDVNTTGVETEADGFESIVKEFNEEIEKMKKTSLSAMLSSTDNVSKTLNNLGKEINAFSKKTVRDSVNEYSKFALDSAKELEKVSPAYDKLSEKAKGLVVDLELLSKNNPKLAASFKPVIDELQNQITKYDSFIPEISEAQTALEKFNSEFEKQKTRKELGFKTDFSKVSDELEKLIEEFTVFKKMSKDKDVIVAYDQEIEKLKKTRKEIQDNITVSEKYNKKVAEISPKLGKTVEGLVGNFNALFKGGVLALFLDSLFAANQQITDLQKNLGISSAQAQNMRAEFAQIAANADDVFINSTKIQKAFTDFSAELGGAVEKSGTMLETFANLTGRFGLNNQEAAKLTSIFGLQSRDTEQVFENTIKTINASRSSGKEFLNTREIIKDISNVSSSVIASLGKSPKILAEAATRARELGLNLDQVEKIADSLLNFESSISAELTAELLTGKQLNLERARFLALNNDIKGLMEEINKQGINFTEFTKMNRIAQEALANTLGMSRAEMTEMLFKQEQQELQIKANRGELDEQTLAQFKALSAQEKFNLAVEKAQAAFADIVIVFSPIIDALGFLADIVGVVFDTVSKIGGALGQWMDPMKQASTTTKEIKEDTAELGKLIASSVIAYGVYKTTLGAINLIQGLINKKKKAEVTFEIIGAAVKTKGLALLIAAGAGIAAYNILNNIEGKAKGGPITSGKPYLVGEEGPELIVPDSSGQVINNTALNALTSPSPTINMQPLIDRLDKLERTLVEYRSVPVVIENNIDGRELNKNTINGLRKGYLTTPSVYA